MRPMVGSGPEPDGEVDVDAVDLAGRARGGTAGGRPGRGVLLIVTAGLLWAGIGLLARPLLDRGVEPVTIAFWRAAVGGVAFVGQAAATRQWPQRGRGVLVAFGVLGVGVFYLALAAAIDTGGLSLAWLLLYTAPAWVALGAPVLLQQPGDRRTVLLVAATIVGIALVAVGGGRGIHVTVASVGWGLLAGLAYASWYFVTGRAGSTPVATGAVALPVGAVVLAPFAAWPGSDAVTLLLLVALGILCTWLPSLAYYRGMQELPAARAAVLATIEPVAAMALAWAVFGERLGVIALVGAAVVLAAAVAAARPRSAGQPRARLAVDGDRR